MSQYTADDLKRQYPELTENPNHALAPIIDLLAELFFQKAKNNPAELGFSDFLQDFSPMFSPPEFKAVFDGKIISIFVSWIDLNSFDEDETWNFVSQISFGAFGDSANELEVKAKETFVKFVATHALEALKASVAVELQKEKTYHLGDEVTPLYLR